MGTTLTAEELKDDSLVNLDGKDWKARIRPDHLELVRVECTDDGDEKSKEKRANIKHEIEMRKQEVDARERDFSELKEQCEQDPDLDEDGEEMREVARMFLQIGKHKRTIDALLAEHASGRCLCATMGSARCRRRAV